MQVFTRRFIFDLVVIALFGAAFYIATHNPITHPKPVQEKGFWSIQLMQHPLIFGIAGHNYLVLRDDNNTIVKELHGLATDGTTKTWKYVGNSESDLLKVWEFNSPRYYIAQKNYTGISLLTGERAQTEEVWNKNTSCKEKINEQNIPYPPYGVNVRGDTENSNSVAYTLILCMGLDPKHIGLITPGWGNNLINEGN